jgi:S-adenosylmethionine hydrolase
MIITLTTDFGLSDPFVGIMKGVILGIAPDVRIVDLSHDVRPYNIGGAAFLLKTSFAYFPAGSVHVAVIDPGVGSARRAVAAYANGHYFVAPDNGVLAYALHPDEGCAAPLVYRISNESLFRKPVSRTFHGRDIFAPVAAHLARAVPLAAAGEAIAGFATAPLPQPRLQGSRLIATVLHVDRFGNIITNLRRRHLAGGGFSIAAGGITITGLRDTFAGAGAGELFAVEGSTGYIEIALNQGSAADRLGLATGGEIQVETVSSIT